MAAASSLGLRCGALKPARLRLGAIEPHDRHPDSEIAAFDGRLGERFRWGLRGPPTALQHQSSPARAG
jgi:hypothetical protein